MKWRFTLIEQRVAIPLPKEPLVAGEIKLSRGIVRQHIGGMKTEASRKPVPMDVGLADVLTNWRGIAPYNQHADYIFASPDSAGTSPIGRMQQWKTTSGQRHSGQESASALDGTRSGTRLARW